MVVKENVFIKFKIGYEMKIRFGVIVSVGKVSEMIVYCSLWGGSLVIYVIF